jgi:hypothetical protein
MSKVPRNQAYEHLEQYEEEMWNDIDWPNSIFWDDESGEMSWQWYMERDIRVREGWTYLTIHPDHKDITVANWLKAQGAEFKYERNHFLIQDSKYATIVAMRWC